jgi:hypothetical protein
MSDSNSVKSVLKAFAIIEELKEKGPMGVAGLSESLGMDKSTVHRLLNTINYGDSRNLQRAVWPLLGLKLVIHDIFDSSLLSVFFCDYVGISHCII